MINNLKSPAHKQWGGCTNVKNDTHTLPGGAYCTTTKIMAVIDRALQIINTWV